VYGLGGMPKIGNKIGDGLTKVAYDKTKKKLSLGCIASN